MSENKNQEVAVNEERFRLVSLATQDTIWDWNLQTNEIWWNEGFKTMFGYSEEEIESDINSWYKRIHPDDLQRVVNRIHELIDQDAKNWSDKYRFRHKDGSYRIIYDRAFILHDQHNIPYRMVGSMVDITESEKVKQELQEREARLNLAISSTGLGTWDFNPRTGELQWDMRCRELFGILSDVPITYETFLQGIHPEDRERTHEIVLRSFNKATGGGYDIEYRTIGIEDQKERWIKAKGKAYFNEYGEVKRFIGTVFDITEQKLNQLRLKESEERFKDLADTAPIFIWMANLGGEVTYSNRTWLNYTGYDSNTLLGLEWSQVIHPDDLQNVMNTYADAFNQRRPYSLECRVKRADQEYRWILFKGEPRFLNDHTITGFLGIGVDIHERKETEKALLESLERFLFLAESIPQKVWTARPDGRIDYLNQRWLDYTATTPEGVKNWDWHQVIHPADWNESEKRWSYSIREGKDFEVRHRLLRKDGVYRWHLSRGIPQKDPQGNVMMWIGTNTDIHDQITILEEIEKANRDLKTTNAELDNFIYTASHDLKAPISNIEGLINALPDTIGKDTLGQEEFRTIMQLVNTSIAKFKQTLLDLTEITRTQRDVNQDVDCVNFEQLVTEIEAEIALEIKNTGARVSTDTSQCPEMNFSRKNLRSIIYNLISNAIKYREPGRIPEIEISTFRIKGYIVLSVKDNGLGIAENKIGRIFEMFKRMHTHVEGTGIGLYIVKRIVENAGGKIEVSSIEHHGTTFRIYFKE